jgi:beta-glucanase (GH16 family)
MRVRKRVAAALTVVCLAGCTGRTHGLAIDDTPAPPRPVGAGGKWKLAFSEEFNGSSLNRAHWIDYSTAEPDAGRGNLGNQQLEWNQAANCTVSGGTLVMTARRQQVTSPQTGHRYGWTSCLITSRGSFTFRYAYLEERSILPSPAGFWPAFWTWQAGETQQPIETDVYEFFSDNHTRLYSTQYSGGGGRCDWVPPFDPSKAFHTYGVAILPAGTTWYADGKRVCHTKATSNGPTNIISNLAVYSKIPPAASTTTATKRVDYIRAWLVA